MHDDERRRGIPPPDCRLSWLRDEVVELLGPLEGVDVLELVRRAPRPYPGASIVIFSPPRHAGPIWGLHLPPAPTRHPWRTP